MPWSTKSGRASFSSPSRVMPGSVTISTRCASRSRQSWARRLAAPVSQRIRAVVAKLNDDMGTSFGRQVIPHSTARNGSPASAAHRTAWHEWRAMPPAGSGHDLVRADLEGVRQLLQARGGLLDLVGAVAQGMDHPGQRLGGACHFAGLAAVFLVLAVHHADQLE